MPEFACPFPITRYPRILMAHGGGGRLMQQLIREVFAAAFGPTDGHDAAVLDLPGARLAFTTDSYVVQPLFFPGGDIGDLAVNGTVNDLAMSGARPLWLSCGFILEEGLAVEDLWRVARSMKRAADAAGVRIVTGDTKVVERGHGDGIYVNTAGVGVVEHGLDIRPESVKPGDAILVSGDIGRHGMAIMAARRRLGLESALASDTMPLAAAVGRLLAAGVEIHCLRDVTRGGLAAVLSEIAQGCGREIAVEEAAIPVAENVRAACELLGFDPLHVACEGRFAAFVPARDAERARASLAATPGCEAAARIGSVSESAPPRVLLRQPFGSSRVVDMLSGEQLPRIC